MEHVVDKKQKEGSMEINKFVLKEVVVDVAKLEEAIAALNKSNLAAEVVHLGEDKAAEQEGFYQGVWSLFDRVDAKTITQEAVDALPNVVAKTFELITEQKKIAIATAAENTEKPKSTLQKPAADKKPKPKPPAPRAENKKEKEGETVATKAKAGKGKATKKAAAKKGGGERLGVFPLATKMLTEGKSVETTEAAVLKLFVASKKYDEPTAKRRAHRTVYRAQRRLGGKKGGKNKKK